MCHDVTRAPSSQVTLMVLAGNSASLTCAGHRRPVGVDSATSTGALTADSVKDRSSQSVPSATACITHGMTSSSMASRLVVASKPSTSFAFCTDGMRFCTSYS